MRRLFWILVGLGLGAVVGLQVARWASKTKHRYSPPEIARRGAGRLDDWRQRLREAVDEGLEEMHLREAELRDELGLQ